MTDYIKRDEENMCDNCEYDYCPQCADETRRTDMNDYIKREDAINVFCWGEDLYVRCGIATQNIKDIPSADVVEVDKAQKEIDYWHDKAQSYEQTILKLALNKADVVEVVRCKDCIYWRDVDHTCKHSFTSPRCANDYCSYGERKDD